MSVDETLPPHSEHPDEAQRAAMERCIRDHLAPGVFLADPINPVEFGMDNGAVAGIMVTTNEQACTDETQWMADGVYVSIWFVNDVPYAVVGEDTEDVVAATPVPLSSITVATIQKITARRTKGLEPLGNIFASAAFSHVRQRLREHGLFPGSDVPGDKTKQ